MLHLKGAVPAFRLEDTDTSGLYHEVFSASNTGYQIRVDEGNVASGSFFRVDIDGSEKMRLDSSGNLLIGTTSTTLYSSTGSTSGLLFDPNGPSTISRNSSAASLILNKTGTTNFGNILDFRKNGTSVGYVAVGSSTTSYNTSSDYRLKENVVPLTGATERLKQLNPTRFNFISDADTTVDGFLAHEVSDIVPEAITGTKDAVDADGNPEYQGIDQSKLVPLLVATIQELEARITALEGN